MGWLLIAIAFWITTSWRMCLFWSVCILIETQTCYPDFWGACIFSVALLPWESLQMIGEGMQRAIKVEAVSLLIEQGSGDCETCSVKRSKLTIMPCHFFSTSVCATWMTTTLLLSLSHLIAPLPRDQFCLFIPLGRLQHVIPDWYSGVILREYLTISGAIPSKQMLNLNPPGILRNCKISTFISQKSSSLFLCKCYVSCWVSPPWSLALLFVG